ncbi:MAG: hypothetical protein M3388_15430 [Acidobacteriota bacterium]|nr:hypothetical protein [Acidobacteriota bacterium]
MSAQTLRSIDDPRNTAPTVGTGGPPGGPTGLFTIYDGQTLRAGEFTFSAAWSNYDRDPGNVDINEIPISFQVGVNDYVELFFNTDAYRGVKVNAPRNLSSFSLPNSQVLINGRLVSAPAIVLGSGAFAGQPIFRNTQNFVQFPFTGGRLNIPRIPFITTPSGGGGGNFGSASNFPGVGSVFGSILPGVVLQTANVGTATSPTIVPTSFTLAPTYLPDAPFINRSYGESAFNTFTVGAKIRFTGPNNPYGVGLIPFYRFYGDSTNSGSGFNQLQRGASPGGGGPNPFGDNGIGDFGLVAFADARLNRFINISGNIGFILNSSVKSGDIIYLDRPNEVISGIGVDFPINRYFQPILEFRSTQYVGGRTPNAFENSPLDAIGGVRFYPTRYISLGAAYRYHINQQNEESFEDTSFTTRTTIPGPGGGTRTTTSTGIPNGFQTSTDPNGFIFQATVGRRNARKTPVVNKFADVTGLELSETRVTGKCPEGQRPRAGQTCTDDMSVNVTTTAVDPENDVLTYNYTVSGGRIVGQGANVSWDLTGAAPGTYTITAGVDDSCGVCGKTQTKTITVEECLCEVICVCPTLSVTGPADVTAPGQTMTFTANVSGGTSESITYNWTVDRGTIIEGQGTPSIRVATTADMAGQSVRAEVTISGVGLCEECPRNASETAAVASPPSNREIDEFGVLAPDDVRTRLDSFFVELQNDPTATGYIINYGTARDVARRETLIRNHIAFRNFDASRINLVRGGENDRVLRTRFVLSPSGATPPTPEPSSTPEPSATPEPSPTPQQ